MDGVESQIAEWRAYVAKAPAVNGRDVDELEAHLRDQIAELDAAGLTADEAFLVAVKRMGDLDTLSREFAREHSGRLWKQLVLSGEDEPARPSSGWFEALVFALAAAVAIQVARLAAQFPDEEPGWLLRNVSLFVLPFLAGYFARRRQLDTRRWVLTAAPFVLVALVVNLYPYARTRPPSSSSRSICPSCCGSRSPTRTWAARSDRTSGAWTSSVSPASGSSTTRSSRSVAACCSGSPR